MAGSFKIYSLKEDGTRIPAAGTIQGNEGNQAGSSVILNGATTTEADFYAPIDIGTDGQILKSNGSGAPSWTDASWLPLSGGTLTGKVQISYEHTGGGMLRLLSTDENEASISYDSGSTSYWVVGKGCGGTGSETFAWWYNPNAANVATLTSDGTFSTSSVYGAVWNDYAEYRSQNENIEPGYITYCDDDGKLKKTTERLQKFEGVVSDTFGFAIGKTDDCKTPLAVSGRVLVYCNPEETFHSGDAVCAGSDGRACYMTREEIIEFPDRIVGIVSEIPKYEIWGTGNTKVNGRIWIKVK